MRPWSDPKILRASSTATEAMETEFEPMSVSVRTCLAAAKADLQKVVEFAGDGAGGARYSEGLLDLAQNLRFADDHGIEAGGDAEEMADSLLIAVLVDVRGEQRGLKAELVVKEVR